MLFFFISCGSFPPGELRGDFRAIVISDAHISNDRGKDARLQLFIEKINRGEFPGIKLLINIGDVASSVYDRFNRDTSKGGMFRLKKAVAMFAHLKIPYYLVMGNHDYKIDSVRDSDTYFPKVEILQMEEIWKKRPDMQLIILLISKVGSLFFSTICGGDTCIDFSIPNR